MSFFVYMIKTNDTKKTKTYVGYTNSLFNRLKKHNSSKGAKSTKGRNWIIIFKKKFISKSKAMSYEYKLKNNKTKRKKLLKKHS